MAQRRREHVELEQLAVAVRHLDGLLPVELQLQSGRRLEARVRLRAAGGPDGDAVLAHELGEGVVAGQVLAGIPVQQPLVDALLGDSRQLRLAATSSMCASNEPALSPRPSWGRPPSALQYDATVCLSLP